jgi:hypothetical protein
MRNFWIVPGSENNWRQSLISKGIWGLEDTVFKKLYWLAIQPNDVILFYISGEIKGIVGYGIIRSKFYQDIPLWDAEIREGCVKWPLRFEFDIDFILPQNMWKDGKIPISDKAGFRQPLILKKWEEIKPLIQALNPKVAIETLEKISVPVMSSKAEKVSPTHEGVKDLLLEIGKLQAYVANVEFPMGLERLDVVWRRLPESVPTYVFEVQIGGDIYHALGKLKHAYDLWNSRIFLIASANDLRSVNELLSGTFHEIQPILKFIQTEKIQSLHQAKRNIYDIERELGIIP